MRTADDDVFMLRQNEPSVIIGKNQNAYAEVNTEYAAERNIHVVRRITGGGAVYHDLGNINYTFIAVNTEAEGIDFARFTTPIVEALAELGVTCTLSGRNDLECDGRKISGSAQSTVDHRTLHHGTLMLSVNLNELSSVLKVDKEKLAYKAVKSHKARVANLIDLLPTPLSAEELINHIGTYVIRTLNATPCDAPDNEDVTALETRNTSDEWIFSSRRFLTEYTVTRRQKFPFGIVQIEMTLCKHQIQGIRISGDFFGTKPIEELEGLLVGKDIREITLSPAAYVDQMTTEELFTLLNG